MKKCKLCGGDIPTSIVIEGKRRVLCNRLYCLKCSPFQGHNTKQLAAAVGKNIETEKKCTKCSQTKPVNAFYARYDAGEYTSWCRACNIEATMARQKKLKHDAVIYKGSKCVCCGYDAFEPALDFHHIDPTQKDFSLSTRSFYDIEKVKKELDKCVLLCCRCHREVEGGFRKLP